MFWLRNSKNNFQLWRPEYKYVEELNESRSDKRDLLAIKAKVRYLQRKKDLVIVNNYRKFEEIFFTNNKDMSV